MSAVARGVRLLMLVGCLSLAQLVAAADLLVALVSVSTPAPRGSEAIVRAQTVPGATCSIEVRYRSGPSRARGLEPKAADTRGEVSWRWQVGSSTTPGRWPILVICSKGPDRGTLYTSFEVR
jgi:hypothetical protein